MPPRDSTITREKVINKLREKGFSYRSQGDRTQAYKNGAHIVHLPRSTTIDERWVRGQFRYIGMDQEEIEAFLAACRA